MEYKKLLIGKNEEDIELTAKRTTEYDALPECIYESGANNNIKQPTHPRTGSKIGFCFAINLVVLILITIISIRIWFIFIKKGETTVNTTTAAIDASRTRPTILTTSTTTTKMITTSIIKTTMVTTSTAKTTMLPTSTSETTSLAMPTTGTTMITTSSTKTTMFTTLTTETTILTMPTTEITMITTSTNFHTTTKNVSKLNKWKQNAITVAGGNGEGQGLNQFEGPRGIFIDEKKNIFIADGENHRVVEWKCNAKEGQIIAGGNGQGSRMNQLNLPTNVIVDQQNDSIIVADWKNRRVIRWLNQTQEILIHNIDCYGLAMDKHGFLYVSDDIKNDVRRWKMGEYNNEGIVVAGGNGRGSQLNQLNDPTFIFVDEDQSVYVSDWENHRVMKWRKGAKEGKVVAGRNGHGRNLHQLSYPAGVIVDNLGQIYVADNGNDRIMRWYEEKEEGEIVVGENSEGIQSDQLHSPRGLSFDDEGNLYVVDRGNYRIQKFEIIL
ncbi:unnamed protein product [Adineta steineri]|uniref:Uncharacterized protein n=1 Tax=Adineta steineri TaxID=433720 RepID=A0A813TZX0_9BILA|nr:unnamed protein product [Adineta steineri]